MRRGGRLRPNVRTAELRAAHACSPKQGQLYRPNVLPLFKSRTESFSPQGEDGKGAMAHQELTCKRILFAKFFDIVYIPRFHCAVSRRVKASRGTGKTH
jgi:hypothetical protein